MRVLPLIVMSLCMLNVSIIVAEENSSIKNAALNMIFDPINIPCSEIDIEATNLNKNECDIKKRSVIAICKKIAGEGIPNDLDEEDIGRLIGRMLVCKSHYLYSKSEGENYSNKIADDFYNNDIK